MGQDHSQHNSHVYNKTGEVIKIVLSDNNGRNTTRVLEHEEVCCIPTVHGTNTLSVFRRNETNSNFETAACASYTRASDHSFIVKKDDNGYINVVRNRPYHIREEYEGLQ